MSDPRPQIVQELLQEIEQVISKSERLAPWQLYRRCSEQRVLLQRVRDVLSLWPDERPELPAASDAVEANAELITATLQTDIQQLLLQRQRLQQSIAELSVQQAQQRSQVMQPLIEQVEQLELFQRRADRTLQDLDASLQLTFRTLDQDLSVHQRSLTQRISQFETLSQQSESILVSLLQQLIREVRQIPSAVEALPVEAVSPQFVPALPQDVPPVQVGPAPHPISSLTELLPQLELGAASAVRETSSVSEADPWSLPEMPGVFEPDE